ncbi:hypothetical protein AKJ38_00315 [candidate division MSBL1 archaeon SCGC-AAA259I14]|uniref:Major facilitator superfamily (MFS) profile domain-containing protein n=3 Tax=candidate division MSBL1 TaxID=215777 RepID=A0A133UU54_9EURY|nr:hypothetical protein AKJ36_02480 [candidate division MSBL1 archaeon SCGC-AAA259I07]KXA97743.1 hypothetical protein AKJ38_00315 [candidate division MSBL1 archaeon SCGC-AAA259I14]
MPEDDAANRRAWTIVIFLFVFLGGLTMQMRGPLVRTFRDVFIVSESVLGLIAPAGSLSFVVSILIVGMRAGKIDFKKFLLLGTGLLSVFTFFVGIAPTFTFVLLFLVGRGISNGVFRAIGRPILSHLYSNQRGRIFNLHSMAWAVGATIGPIFVSIILLLGSWRWAYFIPTFGFLIVFLMIIKLELPQSSRREKILSVEGLKKILRNKFVLGVVGLIVLNGGVEGSFFTWLPYYAEQYFSGTIANLSLSIYLASYIPGRYFYSRVSENWGYDRVILLNASILVLTLLAAFVFTEGVLMMIFVLMTGFLISGNFPTALALGTEHYPEHSAPINALTLSSSALGLSLFPALIGVIADLYTINMAMLTPIFLMVGVFILAFVMTRRE